MEELERQLAALVASHPRIALLAALALLVTNTVNAATSKIDLLALEEKNPRLAGLIWIARGAGQVARWVWRGVMLIALNRRPDGPLPSPESVP
jgi:hypothetical protein